MAGISRRAIAIAAPLVAVGTFMVALRIGAGESVTAAVVFAAPPGAPAKPGGATPFAWQILTYVSDRSVRETKEVRGVTVIARSKGNVATWQGDTNSDGIAEANLALPGLTAGDPVDVEIWQRGESTPLAKGPVRWQDVAWSHARDTETVAVRPSKRQGPIAIDVVIDGERLVVGEKTAIWVFAPAALGQRFELAPEPGLTLFDETTCLNGWHRALGKAEAQAVGLGVTAHTSSGARGEWFGRLPIAMGAFQLRMPTRALRNPHRSEVQLVAPNPRTEVYVEIDDERGRVFADVLPVATTQDDPVPRARFELPDLAPGLHWIVASGEPRGAEHLAGAAVAWPFVVGDVPGVDLDNECTLGPYLARRPAQGFPRWEALDGMATRGARNRTQRTLGLALGVVALASAAVLEILLMIAASREANAATLLADLDDDPKTRKNLVARPPGGGLAIGILLALLGFAALGILFVLKS